MATPQTPITSLERDARRVNEAHAAEVRPGDIAIGVIIGRTSEFFDFFVYAIASVVVFPQRVFPFADPLTGTLFSFAIFAVAFLARPVGTVLFTAIDRSFGRGMKLSIALFLLGTSTVALAFLPGYDQAGLWSVWLLILLRCGQGLALGGSWDGLASLLALQAPTKRRGYYAMIPQLGAPLGLMIASALFAFIISQLTAEDFLDWGWRFPFFCAFAINVVALFARLRIVVTPEYTKAFDSTELQPSPIGETIKYGGKNIVIGAFTPLASFALFHMVTVFPLSWVFLFTKDNPARFLVMQAVGAALGVGAIVASGWLADRIGRKTLLGGTAAAIAAFSGFAPQLLAGGTLGEAAFMASGYLLLGLAFGQASGAVAANFPKQYRYTGSALTSDMAWLFGAGFAPWVALELSSRFGLGFGGVYLLSGALATLIALYVNKKQIHYTVM
jgi:MFS family permease